VRDGGSADMGFLGEVFNLAVVWVEQGDVGEVLLALGIGVPVAAVVGMACHSSGYSDLGNLLLSAAAFGVLPFLMLSCQTVTGI